MRENDEQRLDGERVDRSLGSRMFGERVLDAVPEAVFVFDATARLVWWNRHATAATGYDDAELAALDPTELVHPDDRRRFETWVEGLLSGEAGAEAIETTLVDADGESIPYEFVGALLDDNDDSVAGAVTTGRDISDRYAIQELERQNERLEEFASVVSHDLRNPLTVAEGYLSLARLEVNNDDLERVGEAHRRMYDLIDDLLTLARAGNAVGETEAVELAGIARQGWASVDTGDAELVVEGDLTLEADPRRLRELFENLFRNAVEHASPLTGADGADADTDADGDGDPVDGRSYVTVTVGPLGGDGFYVADDGPGVPEAIRDGVFESGYTTTDEGTGFGLAIVEDIAEAHGWTVELARSADGGARFEVSGTDA